ncbi:MAG: hypothetical protein K6U80_19515 [Firmicutes bacterium]|nr:hypothetical protein [Bacillota bacterium]
MLIIYQNIYKPLQKKKLKQKGFQDSDIWILLSIIHTHGNKGASLEDLIRGADYINKTIPTISEIEGAINRFLESGIINIVNGKFILTDATMKDYEAISQKTKSYLEQWDLLEKLLIKKHFKKQKFIKYIITNDIYKEAYEKYHDKFNRLTQK